MTFSFSVITNIIFTVIILQKMDKPWNISCLNTTRAWDSPDCANVPRTIGFPDAWRKHDEHGPGVQGVEIPGPQFSIRNLHWIHWKSDYHMGIILFLIITTLNCHVIHDITTHSRDAHPFTNDFFGPGLDSIERSGSPSCQIPWKDSWRFHGFCFEIYWCFSKCCHVCRFLWNDLLWYLMHLICQQMTIVHLPQHPTVDPHFINQHGRHMAIKLVYVPCPFSWQTQCSSKPNGRKKSAWPVPIKCGLRNGSNMSWFPVGQLRITRDTTTAAKAILQPPWHCDGNSSI